MKLNKKDIDFNTINKVADDLDNANVQTVLMLNAILIKGLSQVGYGSVDMMLANVKAIADKINQ